MATTTFVQHWRQNLHCHANARNSSLLHMGRDANEYALVWPWLHVWGRTKAGRIVTLSCHVSTSHRIKRGLASLPRPLRMHVLLRRRVPLGSIVRGVVLWHGHVRKQTSGVPGVGVVHSRGRHAGSRVVRSGGLPTAVQVREHDRSGGWEVGMRPRMHLGWHGLPVSSAHHATGAGCRKSSPRRVHAMSGGRGCGAGSFVLGGSRAIGGWWLALLLARLFRQLLLFIVGEFNLTRTQFFIMHVRCITSLHCLQLCRRHEESYVLPRRRCVEDFCSHGHGSRCFDGAKANGIERLSHRTKHLKNSSIRLPFCCPKDRSSVHGDIAVGSSLNDRHASNDG
eukprot:m.912125 g.912125  ORF g.912125 m.912125 type:complete len:338 (+) comp23726_c1_seq15:160-1173(+)